MKNKTLAKKIVVSTVFSEQAISYSQGQTFVLCLQFLNLVGKPDLRYALWYYSTSHSVGGLKDTVISYPKRGSTGFLFNSFTVEALVDVIKFSINTYNEPRRWRPLMKRAMKTDFSVEKMAKSYHSLYVSILKNS